MYRKFFVHCFYLLALLCASCGGLPDQGGDENASSTAPQEGLSDEELSDDVPSDDVKINKAVVIPPGYNNRRGDENKTDAKTLPNGLPALTPAKGLNLQTLFSEKLKDPDDRIERLENAFLDFRREYESVKPAIVRLAAIEEDIQGLINELESFVEEETEADAFEDTPNSAGDIAGPISEPIKSDPVEAEPLSLLEQDKSAAPEEHKTMTPPPIKDDAGRKHTTDDAAKSTNANLLNVRTGLHPDKLRIVIELSDKTDYALDLGNQEKLLFLTFKDTSIGQDLAANKTLPLNAVLSSYSAQQEADILRLTFDLKKNTEVLSQEWLTPTLENAYHRLVIDLAL